jgi:hypothetical protein
MNIELADIAIREVNKYFHGNCMGSITNLKPIADLFPYTETWTIDSWDNVWCAAFVYYCVILCGYKLPIKPEGDFEVNFAGVGTWNKWSKLPEVNKFIPSMWIYMNQHIKDYVIFMNGLKMEGIYSYMIIITVCLTE